MRKIVAIFSVFVMMMSICITSVSAANVCYGAGGSLRETKSFVVSVGNKLFASEKIILSQTQGATRQVFYGKEKAVGMYGRFYVSVYDETAKKNVIKNDKWKSASYTISSSKLKNGHSYTITVRGDLNTYVGDSYSNFPYVFRSWSSYPIWSVKTTGKNINVCGW